MRLGLWLFFTLYSNISNMINCLLDLEPAGVLYVCSGGALRVNCSTSAELLEWNITFPNSPQQMPITISYGAGSTLRTENIVLPFDFITLNVSVTRPSEPLISIISFDNATAELNRSLIICSGFNFDSGESASVQLNLVRRNGGNINISEQFEVNSVTVTLRWSTKNGVNYIVNIEPAVAVSHTGRSRNSAQLSVPYNMEYNVSVTASLCGDNRTTFSLLNYVKCPQPSPDSSVIIVGFRNPALEGITITFSCPLGLVITGPNTLTCMGNGKWEPNLNGTMCKVECNIRMVNSNVSLNYSSTLEGSLLTFQCVSGLLPDDVFAARCYKNGSWIPNPSSHVCAASSAANCGHPSPPSDGYLEPFTSTSEGAKVKRVHMCQNRQIIVEEIVCSSDGEWETVNGCACSDFDLKLMVTLITSISGLLGSLLAVALLVCRVLIVVIAVIARKKGMAVSSSREQKSGLSKSKHQNPEYEEVMASRNEAARDEPEELEMMHNVAYGPLQLR